MHFDLGHMLQDRFVSDVCLLLWLHISPEMTILDLLDFKQVIIIISNNYNYSCRVEYAVLCQYLNLNRFSF